MKFDYLKLPTANPKHRWIARPMLPVRLIGPTGKWQGLALVDSGADVSLFGERVGKRIGISDVGPRVEKFGGVEGGSLSANVAKVRIEIEGMTGQTEIEAGFTNSPGIDAILGQDGFFDAFRVKFEKDHDTFEIIPVKK